MSAIRELDETDPVLGHLLELLQAAPERDIRSAREGRSKFIAELDELFPVEAAVPVKGRRSAPAGSLLAGSGGVEGFIKSLFRPPRLVWAPITIGITVLLFLAFTGAATVRVAEKALPGDALYNLKTSIEQAELAVVTDPVDEATLNLKYAERRLVEANELAANGRVGDAQALVLESDARMKSAYATLLRVQKTDPERAEQLRKIVLFRLEYFNGLVSNMYVTAPPALVPVLQSVMSSVNSFVPEPNEPAPANNGNPQPPAGSDKPTGNANDNSNDADDAPPDCEGAACAGNEAPNGNSNDNSAPDTGNPGQANNNGNGPENNNGGGQENNNGNGPKNNNGGGQENNNGNGPDNNNGGGQENNNGGGNDPDSGSGQEEGDDGSDDGGDDGGDDGSDDGNNGGGNDDKDKDKPPKPPKEPKS